MGMQVIRHSESPELWADTATITREVWPEYNLHSEDPNGNWGRLFDEFPESQFVLYHDQERQVIPEGHTLRCEWDGTPEGLGEGIDTTIAAVCVAVGDRDAARSHLPQVLDRPQGSKKTCA